MKKICLLILLPLLLAFQCEDDLGSSGFESSYILQNNSSTTLFLLAEDERLIEIMSQTDFVIARELNSETDPIAPSQSFMFNQIKLYAVEDENYILVYSQDPLADDLWDLNEPVMNRFNYTLLITDEVLN